MLDFEAALEAAKDFGDRLVPEEIKFLSLSGGYWVAGFLSGDLPCYFIGGPDIPRDARVFSSPESALGALAHHLRQQRPGTARITVRSHLLLMEPDQREVGGGWYFVEVVGAHDPTFIVIGPSGPEEGDILDSKEVAQMRAYEAASRGPPGY